MHLVSLPLCVALNPASISFFQIIDLFSIFSVGLFAMTIKCRTKASELYEESIPLLSEVLNPDANNSRVGMVT